MTDLADWLAEVHAADEQVVRAGMSGQVQPWSVFKGDTLYINSGSVPIATVHGSGADPDVAAHIARHDPQSVLARIEAERMVAALHRPNRYYNPSCATCYDLDTSCAPVGVAVDSEVPYPCPTLRALAWGYRHREGWQASWAPGAVAADVR